MIFLKPIILSILFFIWLPVMGAQLNPDIWSAVWDLKRSPQGEVYLGLETAFWNVDFEENNSWYNVESWFDPKPRKVARDPYNLAVIRTNFHGLWGFNLFAEVKLTGVSTWEQLWNGRNVTLSVGDGGTSLKTKVSRYLGFLVLPVAFFYPEIAPWKELFNNVSFEFQSLTRKYNWYYFDQTSVVDLNGSFLPSAQGVVFPADTLDQRYSLKSGIIEWFLPFVQTEWESIYRESKEDFDPDEVFPFPMWGSFSLGTWSQSITTPMNFTLSNWYLYLKESQGGTQNTTLRKESSFTFLTKNQFNGVFFGFKTFDVETAPPWNRMPVGVNLQMDWALGKSTLTTALFETQEFDASRFELQLELYFRFLHSFWFKVGSSWMNYNYMPLVLLRENSSVSMLRDFTAGSFQVTKDEPMGLDMWREESFFTLNFEGAYRF